MGSERATSKMPAMRPRASFPYLNEVWTVLNHSAPENPYLLFDLPEDAQIFLPEGLPSHQGSPFCQHEPFSSRKACLSGFYCRRASCLICRYYPFDDLLTGYPVAQKKPYSAVTVQVDRLTSEQYEEDDISGIINLVEVIRIQAAGPTEAARALRKKLKYGNTHRQLRALTIIDGLIDNAGSRFQRTFADEPLLERLRLLAREDGVDKQVREKCQLLFKQWSTAYKDTPGLSGIANLYKELPKSRRPAAARQKVLQEVQPDDHDFEPASPSNRATPAPAVRPPPTTTSSSSSATPIRPVSLTAATSGGTIKSSKNKKGSKTFNLAKEKENMTTCIARSSIASTNLLNGLQLVNRESQRVSDNKEVLNRFEICKALRRQILTYIQLVESDDWIGSLVNANDELVKALTAYEIMDRSIDDDSDSDAWENPGSGPASSPKHVRNISQDARTQLEGLSLSSASPPSRPPRPAPSSIAMPSKPPVPTAHDSPKADDDDDGDPFGDSNAVATPHQELRGMTWREV